MANLVANEPGEFESISKKLMLSSKYFSIIFFFILIDMVKPKDCNFHNLINIVAPPINPKHRNTTKYLCAPFFNSVGSGLDKALTAFPMTRPIHGAIAPYKTPATIPTIRSHLWSDIKLHNFLFSIFIFDFSFSETKIDFLDFNIYALFN